MQKSIKLELNAFPEVPPSLFDPMTGKALEVIGVELADLYHHYYNDTYNLEPPDPDPAHFEHVRYLTPDNDFRFQSFAQGINKTAKGNKSTELGVAFCRWFLSRHLDIDYIAHIDAVRDHGALSQFGGVKVESNPGTEGDAPDYFCANGPNQVFLAEAKGRRAAVGFGSQAFKKWRKQFERVRVLDRAGVPLSVKGYIVAMRWAFENDSSRIQTTLLAEDPATVGERPLGNENVSIAYAIKSIHYAGRLRRLRQPLIAEALQRGLSIQSGLEFNATVWQSSWPPLAKKSFVGGYYPSGPDSVLPFKIHEGRIIQTPPDILRLDIGSGTFIGIEEETFKIIAATAREGPSRIGNLRPLERADTGYSGVSLLRDGHVIGPIDFFYPARTITF